MHTVHWVTGGRYGGPPNTEPRRAASTGSPPSRGWRLASSQVPPESLALRALEDAPLCAVCGCLVVCDGHGLLGRSCSARGVQQVGDTGKVTRASWVCLGCCGLTGPAVSDQHHQQEPREPLRD